MLLRVSATGAQCVLCPLVAEQLAQRIVAKQFTQQRLEPSSVRIRQRDRMWRERRRLADLVSLQEWNDFATIIVHGRALPYPRLTIRFFMAKV